jgi:dienelactone hydrolase
VRAREEQANEAGLNCSKKISAVRVCLLDNNFVKNQIMKTLTIILSLISFAAVAQGEKAAYNDGDTRLEGLFYKAAGNGKKSTGVIILHAWMGITDHERTSAQKLAAEGYQVLVADVYGDKKPAEKKDAAAASGYFKKNFREYQSRIRAAIAEMEKRGCKSSDIVIMGYCFGGTGALEAARGQLPVKGVVSFHGGLGKDSTRKNSAIATRVLVLHGADDPFVPEKDIKQFQNEMREGGADWQMVYYADAVHAFTEKNAGSDKSKGAAYNEKADQRSWRALLEFLREGEK